MKYLDIVAPTFFEANLQWFIIIGGIVVLVAVICLVIFFKKGRKGGRK